MPPSPSCRSCKLFNACTLAQKERGEVCGWFNVNVAKAITVEKPKAHTITTIGVPTPAKHRSQAGPPASGAKTKRR